MRTTSRPALMCLTVWLLIVGSQTAMGEITPDEEPAPGQQEYAERTERLLAAALEAGDELATAQAQHDLAQHMKTLGLWPQALTHATLARQTADHIDDPDTRVAIDITYASVLLQLDRTAEATGILLTALEKTRALENTEQELWALLGLSSAYVGARQLPEGRRFGEQGLALARETGNRLQEVRLLSNLGLIAWTDGDAATAARHIQSAVAVPVDELPPDVHKTLILASITLAGTEGEDSAERARAVIDAARRDGSRYMEGFATEQLGHILCNQGETGTALRTFEEARDLFLEVDRLGDLRRLHERWAECLASMGNYAEALDRVQEALSLADQVNERRQHETLTAHDIAFRTEQRIGEVARLAGEEQALQARVARQRAFTGWLTAGTLLLLGVLAGFWVRNRRLRELRNAELALQQARVDLLARTSHEIRNPAQGIIGILEGISERERPDGNRDRLDVALAAARMIGHLANDFLDLALLEQNRLQLRSDATCHLSSLVDAVMALGQSFVPAGHGRLRSQIESNVPDHVQADGERLTQVLLNLISNAAQYGGGGDITLRVDVNQTDNRLEFTVDDTGPGLDPAMVANINPYARGGQTRANPRGSGLGLAISSRIVNAMGGNIVARKRPEGGARMVVSIPLEAARPPASEPASDTAWKAGVTTQRPQGQRVLVVDDDHFARLGLCTLLGALGARVMELDSEDRLLDSVRDFEPALVLMDLHVHDVLGTDLADRIREDDDARGRKRIIAMISGSAQPPEPMDVSIDCWLVKPIERQALTELLARTPG